MFNDIVPQESPANPEATIQPPTSSAAPPPAEFDMHKTCDVIAKVGFKFNKPKQLESKSNKGDVKRIAKIVAIVEDTLPGLTDYERAAKVFSFYTYWATKKDRAGQPLSIPINEDSFGRNWREWLGKLQPVPVTQPRQSTIFQSFGKGEVNDV